MAYAVSATTELPPVGTWQLDTLHSSIGFAIKHNLISTYRGRFEDFDARLTVDSDGRAELAGTVNAASVAVKDQTLAQHLQAPDFFDTERFPELRFRSSKIRRSGEHLELEGELTIKDNTRPVTATGRISGVVDDPFEGQRLGIELEAAIDRSEYGLNWNMPMPRGGVYLSNEVTLTITLEFTKEA
jgi:polyisoprenoid-binding protein YceI